MISKKINTVENVWQSKEEITKIRSAFSSIFSQNTGSFEKYVQTLTIPLISKHLEVSPNILILLSTPLGVWKSKPSYSCLNYYLKLTSQLTEGSGYYIDLRCV